MLACRGTYKALNKEAMEQDAKLNSAIIESLNNVSTIKTNGAEVHTAGKIEKEFAGSMLISFRSGTISNI